MTTTGRSRSPAVCRFADGRGHLLFNGEYTHRDGIYGVPRSWNNDGRYIMNNPALHHWRSGLPERLVVSDASLTTATLGGIITNTALRGRTFGEGGAPRTSSNTARWCAIPGCRAASGPQISSINTTRSIRKSIVPGCSYAAASPSPTTSACSRRPRATNPETLSWQLKQFNLANLVIRAGNPFISSVGGRGHGERRASRSSRCGTMNADIPDHQLLRRAQVTRYMAGFEGSFGLFGGEWNWDAYYQLGTTESSETGYNISSKARYAAALDAVVNPANGQPICRSTLTAPTNGCLPYNPMGINVNSPETIARLLGSPHRDQRFAGKSSPPRCAANRSIRWAGPVSIAMGVERREEKVRGERMPPR